MPYNDQNVTNALEKEDIDNIYEWINQMDESGLSIIKDYKDIRLNGI